MNREELKSIFDALRNDPQHHLGLGDIRLTIAQQDEILDSLSLPPAEGATDKFRDVLNEVQRLIEINDGATGGELRAIWNSLSCAITESEKKPHPTAEGAEEIAQRCPVCGGNGLVPNGFYLQTSGSWLTASITPETCRSCNGTGVVFATLRAQRLAEKMVSEKLRDELVMFGSYFNNLDPKDHILVKDIDEYLNGRNK